MKILMVCLGNICRSPVAAGILRQKAQQMQLNIVIDSAGTSSWHSGECPDKRAIVCAQQHSVDISKAQARQFTAEDFSAFDRIYVMDSSNYNDIMRLAVTASHKDKVKLIMNEVEPDSNKAVPDPYYGSDADFEQTYSLLDDACNSICKQLATQDVVKH